MQIISKNREETLALGEKLGKGLTPGDIVLLFGELGAGKTTLTQGITTGLGLEKDEYIRSPTFAIINEYAGRSPVYHIDLFRLDTFSEIENLGLEEFFFGAGVTVVEWAEKLFADKTPENSIGFGIEARLEIHISLGENDCRVFGIQPVNMRAEALQLFALQ